MENYLPKEINGGTIQPTQALVQIEQSRAVEEVQAAMVIAKKFPRDEYAAEARIMKECERKSLAEVSQYAYPRGNTTVSGPSIRLAETLARCWGNMVYGLRELTQSNGTSEVEAYCHDLETNTKASRTFVVKHIRQKKSGNIELSDPRDIYEMVSNQGQRRVRACILEIIPGDIQDKAVEQCNKTLKSAYSEPLEDRITNMIRAFDKIGVPQVAIERKLNHVVSVITETEIAGLKKIYQSIKDGMSNREDWFDLSSGQTETVRDRINKSQEKRLDAQITKTDIKYEPQEEKTFRDEYIYLKEKGFKPWIFQNKDKILANPENWEEIAMKWMRHYRGEPFPFRLKVEEPTEQEIETEPEPPQEMSNESEPEQNFDNPADFVDTMAKLANAHRNIYFAVMREKGFESLSQVKENQRKELYEAVLSAIGGVQE